jgi:hypothetical protein
VCHRRGRRRRARRSDCRRDEDRRRHPLSCRPSDRAAILSSRRTTIALSPCTSRTRRGTSSRCRGRPRRIRTRPEMSTSRIRAGTCRRASRPGAPRFTSSCAAATVTLRCILSNFERVRIPVHVNRVFCARA